MPGLHHCSTTTTSRPAIGQADCKQIKLVTHIQLKQYMSVPCIRKQNIISAYTHLTTCTHPALTRAAHILYTAIHKPYLCKAHAAATQQSLHTGNCRLGDVGGCWGTVMAEGTRSRDQHTTCTTLLSTKREASIATPPKLQLRCDCACS